MTATNPPPLPADLNEGLKRLKMAAMRRLAPELLVTAKTQRWKPEEFLRTLIEAEIATRDASKARTLLVSRGVPGHQDAEFDVAASSVPAATFDYLASPEWIRAAENEYMIGPAGTGKSHILVAVGIAGSRPATGSATLPPLNWSRPATAAWPTTPWANSSTPCCATTSCALTSSASRCWTTPVPNCCSGSSPPPTNTARSASGRTGRSSPRDGRFLPEHATAVSTLDGLLHHCDTVVTDGDSCRMKQARAKGGIPTKMS